MSSLIKKDQKKTPIQFLDFDQLAHKKYNYDQKKANELSIKQEQYIHDLKKAYDQQKLEIEPLFQKVELLQIERKQLMDEIEQYKMSQMEILKKYESEYQEKDKLNKECAKLKSQIQAQQKIQLPKEFQEKKCHELKESLFVTIKDIMNDFLDNYNNIMGFKDDNEFSSNLLDELLQQIDDSIIIFVDNLPAQSNKQLQSEEIQHLKDQIEKTIQTVSNLQAENQDLSTALDIEKQHKEKIIHQRNTQQQIINQLNNQIDTIINEKKTLESQIDTIINEKKTLESQIQEIQMKNLEFQQDICRVNDFKEEENEKLKSQFIDSINELQKQISKLQIENTRLTTQIQNNIQHQIKDIELLNNKLRELESKLNQEEIKYEYKSKEMSRIEKEMLQYKAEATKLFEENNIHQQQLEVIKEKRKQDKEVLDQQKDKFKKLKLQFQQSEIELQTKIAQLEQQIIQLTQQLEQNNSTQSNNLNTEILMEKDLEISKLDQLVSESTQKINDQKQLIVEMKIQINSLEQQLLELKLTHQQHQDRRAIAFSEINRIEQQNSILKQRINDQDITIKQLQSEIQELLKQSKINSQQNHTSILNKSFTKTLINEGNNLDSSRLSDTDSQISKTAKAASIILNGLNYFKIRPQVTIQQVEDPDRKIAEKALQKQAEELKFNLEQLYKSFLSTLLLNQVNDEKFLKFERQINECVKKTQDLHDNIEDFF